VIHQTYRTYDIPAVWNTSVKSVIEMNADEFTYRRWSHTDMDTFVQQHEPHFYWNTYVTYRYDIQRADSFRYVLLFHVGGIYIDMNNGCNRPFREIVATMEALNPESPQLALFPAQDTFGVQNDFMIATSGHPIFKQFTSRLHLFHHSFLIHHITILLSAGPRYATFQERLFTRTDKHVVRILENQTFRSMFWKTNGGTWFGRDTIVILNLYHNDDRILWYCKILAIWLAVLFIAIMLYRRQRRRLIRLVNKKI
jgi:mannosyltransferase OCH1-like enzyme